MTIIVALCGTKQSGKNTLNNFLHGHEMKLHDIINHFDIKPDGKLEVNTVVFDEKGKEHLDYGILDLEQKNDMFFEYASRYIWPLIKSYSFADNLKQVCMNLFDIPHDCLYGTDEQKNQLQEHLLWENMPGVITCPELWDHMHPDGESEYSVTYHKPGPMTAREFMQYFGTDICRKIYQPIWVNGLLKQIEYDQPPIAVITDCRFINEMKAMRKNNALLVRLLRSPYNSDHASEKEVDDWKDYDCVIDNREMSVQESCDSLLDFLIKQGVTRKIRLDTGRYVSIK
jgi:hypothetical protein